ncbi:hypothetical protein BVC80_8927g20 [Macleaya cordata]|uniref:Uncharacterized protein n=1 Tax=Macleaya cordata TaxID=56857 RepID=A0A200R0C6_MACCD|nr:hypothetical protein BVC80_8927g20 [Macleaya cordata]
MVLLKSLRAHQFYSFLRHQNSSLSLKSPPHCFPNVHEYVSRVSSFSPSSLFQRNLSIITQFASSDVTEERIETKSTDSEELKNSDCEEKSDASSKREKVHHESLELKPFKELSPEIVLLVNRLYEKGYFKNANFLPPDKLDLISCFSSYYSRNFLRSAAESFGQDHPEILKSLSFTDLERIARFGCPYVEKKTAFAAKRLRSFFGIQEDIVCRACKLKSACKVAKQTVSKRKVVRTKKDDLSLVDIMRVLTLYGLELVPAQLVIPSEIKDSVSKLLKVLVNTSQISLEEKSDASEREQVHDSIVLKPLKELSPEIVLFVTRLYEEGYFKDANFLPPEKFDLSCFSSYYSRDFIRSAAQRFGRDHKEIKE